ncbi:MAG: glutathione S-transferase C-terminal domain-containing protein [Pseudomonadota bacterium]
MELYYSPMACSFAAHVICHELGQPPKLHRVHLRQQSLADGSDYKAINPTALVPTLVLESGDKITETVAVLSYLADQAAPGQLAPKPGTPAFYHHLGWMAFINTELHKRIFHLIFWPGDDEDAIRKARALAPRRLDQLEDHFADRPFLMGDRFMAGDAYLLWWLMLTRTAGIDLAQFPRLRSYLKAGLARPSVASAKSAEDHDAVVTASS